MENKFEDELIKIEKLLNKIDSDLNTENIKTEFTTFFKNIDKTFEIYNICLEELCGQLYLLELSSHSKVFRKLYHHYKHQLYNIMKYQLSIQKELNDKIEEEKNYKSKIDMYKNTIAILKEKKMKLHYTIDEQKLKIEKLIIQNNQQNEKIKLKKRKSQLTKRNSSLTVDFRSSFIKDDNFADIDPLNIQENEIYLLQQVQNVLNDETIIKTNPQTQHNLQKLLGDIEKQKQYIEQLQNIKMDSNKSQYYKLNFLNKGKKDAFMMTSQVFYTKKDYENLQSQLTEITDQHNKLKTEFSANTVQTSSNIQELNNSLNRVNEENLQIKENMSYIENINEDLRKEIKNLESNETILNAQMNEMENKIDEKNKKLEILIKKVKDLENINGAIQEEIIENTNNQNSFESQQEEFIELQQEKQYLEQKVTKYENKELDRDVQVNKNIELLLENKNQKIGSFESEMNKMVREKKERLKKVSELKNEYLNLENTHNDLIIKFNTQVRKNKNLKTILRNIQNDKEFAEKFQQNALKKNKLKMKKRSKRIKSNIQISQNKISQPKGKSFNDQKQSYQEDNQHQFDQDSVDELINLDNQITNSKKKSKRRKTRKTKKRKTKKSVIEQNQKSQQEQQQEGVSNQPISEEEEIYSEESYLESEYENSQIDIDSQYDFSSSEVDLINKNIDPKQSTLQQQKYFKIQQILNELGDKKIEEIYNKIQKLNTFDIEEYLNQQIERDLQGSDDVKITCHRGTQSRYFSPIEYILESKDEVFCKEGDFEKIKQSIDVLSQIIGYENIEDLHEHVIQPKLQLTAQQERGQKYRKSFFKKDINNMIPQFQDKKAKQKIQIKTNNMKRTEIKIESDSEDKSETDNEKKKQIKTKKKFVAFKFKQKSKKINIKNYPEDNKENEIDSEEDIGIKDWRNDYVVQKKKIITTENQTEKIEFVEYIRIPKELQVKKSIMNPLILKNKLKKVKSFEERLLNNFERQQREQEKIYFQMYLNIKNRYKYQPEKLIKLFKIYFNKVPEFEKNLTENYDPDVFLFNFMEFKIYFKQIINTHQRCGADCVHLKRFYEITEKRKFSSKQMLKMSQAIIKKLPKLLTDDL